MKRSIIIVTKKTIDGKPKNFSNFSNKKSKKNSKEYNFHMSAKIKFIALRIKTVLPLFFQSYLVILNHIWGLARPNLAQNFWLERQNINIKDKTVLPKKLRAGLNSQHTNYVTE